jgi:hypothetical protein
MSAMKELYYRILEEIARTDAKVGQVIVVDGYQHTVSPHDIIEAEAFRTN